jgi:hypothetical protein
MVFDGHPSVVPLKEFVPLALHQDLVPETRASIPAPRTWSRRTQLLTQLDIIAGSRQRATHDAHDLRTIGIGGHRHLGGGVQLGKQRVRLGPSQLLAALVDAPGSFLERIAGVGVGTSRAARAPWSSRSFAALGSGSPPCQRWAAGSKIFSSRLICFSRPARNSVYAARSIVLASVIARRRRPSRRSWSFARKQKSGPGINDSFLSDRLCRATAASCYHSKSYSL